MSYNILQITNKPPFPLVDGGSLGIAKMSKFYSTSNTFNFDIFTYSTYKHKFDTKIFEKEFPKNTIVFSVFVDTKPSIFKAIRSLILNKSYNLSRFKNQEIEDKLIEILSNKEYDFIQIENIFVGQHMDIIRKYSKAKVILNSANVEYEIWERLATKASLFKRKYFNILAKQLKKEEESIWKQMDGVICATDKDKQTIKRFLSEDKMTTVPFYLNTQEYKVKPIEIEKEISFFHLGAMDWLPNQEGVTWFLDNVWSKLESKNKLYLAGKDMPETLLNRDCDRVEVRGFVEDAKEYMSSYSVMVVPLLSGSGIRVKIIEAMAMGRCIISTTIGAEGIEYTANENILLADSKEEFLKVIEDLNANPEKIKTIGTNARLLAESNYDIKRMDKKINPFLEKI